MWVCMSVCMYTYAYIHVCHRVHVELRAQISEISFFRNPFQVISHGGKCPHQLNHPTGPITLSIINTMLWYLTSKVKYVLQNYYVLSTKTYLGCRCMRLYITRESSLTRRSCSRIKRTGDEMFTLPEWLSPSPRSPTFICIMRKLSQVVSKINIGFTAPGMGKWAIKMGRPSQDLFAGEYST